MRRKRSAAAERALMNSLIEHCPEPPYPLDCLPFKAVGDAKAEAFALLGIVIGDELDLDAEGGLSPLLQKTRIGPNLLRLPGTVRGLLDFAHNEDRTAAAFRSVRADLQSREREDLTTLTDEQLVGFLKALLDASREIARVRFRHNVFPFVILSKLLKGRLNRVERGLTEYDLLVDLPYHTVRMNEALCDLAATPAETAEFAQRRDAFIQDFGWRSTASYLAFSSTSFKESPESLHRALEVSKRSMRPGPSKATEGRYADTLQKLKEVFRPKAARRLLGRIGELRAYHMNREESLYLLETCYGLLRRCARELERRSPSVFGRQGDILFLTMEEVCDRAWAQDPDACRARIERRRERRASNIALWNALEIDAKAGGADKKGGAGVLRGASGNRGATKAPARVILTLEDSSLMQPGEVLVCRYTDPSWTPLFSLAAAVVSDTGGPLSHSAIVAREYGIPAVLGCGCATTRIHSGDIVLVDGSNGRVHLP